MRRLTSNPILKGTVVITATSGWDQYNDEFTSAMVEIWRKLPITSRSIICSHAGTVSLKSE